MSLTWSSCSSDRNLCTFTTWEVFLERTDNILGRGPVWLYSVCVCSCLCVQPIRWALTGPVVSIRPAAQLSLLICWDWLACRCNSLHQSPSARVCLVGSGTSACHFYTSEGRDGVGGGGELGVCECIMLWSQLQMWPNPSKHDDNVPNVKPKLWEQKQDLHEKAGALEWIKWQRWEDVTEPSWETKNNGASGIYLT